ncbi:MAG: CopG family transcriptional regulator [Gemmatimonadetes bacterium]|nr:CopG family transcriptional regulator [Gemmatimonadota bacterium]
MSKKKTIKTTLYLSPDEYHELKSIASAEGIPAARCVREAVAEYVHARSARLRPSSIGVGRSGRHDLSERSEDLLDGFGRS